MLPGDGRWIRPPGCESVSCAEVRFLEEVVEIRDSDAPGVIVCLSHEDWNRFIAGAKAGAYDIS